jgi:RHS repeat-associated protein
MTNDGANSLTYDAENHAVAAAGATYTYDGNGLRVKKLSGGTTTVYIFSGSKVLAEYVNGAAPASPTREYVYSGSQMLAKIEAGVTNYYHSDHLSARVITDSTGTIVGQRAHYPYGETWYETGTTTKVKFTSYERDSESGNDFALARYHVNRLGRFSSPDLLSGSIKNPQSLNRYTYVGGDGINATDPSGLLPSLEYEDNGRVYGGGGSSWGSCIVDFMITNCGFASSLMAGGAAVQCPNNMCSGFNADGVPVQFVAGAGGATGYLSAQQIAAGLNEVNGKFLTNAQYNEYIQTEFAKQIDAQRKVLALTIAPDTTILLQGGSRPKTRQSLAGKVTSTRMSEIHPWIRSILTD